MRTRNLFVGMLAVAGIFSMTSCQQDETLFGGGEGKYVTATYNLVSPEGMHTRTIGDGTTVNYVVCATFDERQEEMKDLRQVLPIVDKTTKYEISLVKGQNYRVAFFAYYAEEGTTDPKHYDVTNMKRVQILGDQLCNIEERDAFTAYDDIEEAATMQPIKRDITLYRPFAQLNLGSYEQDWINAVKAGVTVNETQITVSDVYTTFSAFDDAVVGETSEVTFKLNALPSNGEEWLMADVDLNGQDEAYKYLALNYLLVGDKKNEKNLTDVTFVWHTADGKTNHPVTEFKNIPVQRNYRTNILGMLLTNPAEYNITIDERFEKPDYNIVAIDGTVSADELAESGYTDYIDNGATEVAIIENMHITADETAIVVDDIAAPNGTLLVQNSTINAKLFMELNMYYTIIVRNCHLNVEELFNITTGKTAYQIIFSNCYLNGEPMVKEKKSEYFDQNFLSLNTVNISFSNEDNVDVPDNGGNNGDDNQGGNNGDDNQGDDNGDDNQGGNNGDDNQGGNNGDDNQGGAEAPATVKFSEVKGSYSDSEYGKHFKDVTFGTFVVDEAATMWFENATLAGLKVEKVSTIFLENVNFESSSNISWSETTNQIYIQNCYVGGEKVTRENYKSLLNYSGKGTTIAIY